MVWQYCCCNIHANKAYWIGERKRERVLRWHWRLTDFLPERFFQLSRQYRTPSAHTGSILRLSLSVCARVVLQPTHDPHPQPSFLVPRPSRRPPITSLAATVKWQQTVGVGSVGRVPIHHREVSALVVSDEKGEGFYEEGDGVGSCI